MDKAKQKLIDKLGKKGFDTEKKVNAIDMQVAFDNGLTDELGGILALQKAIKTHSVYAFLMDGVDAKPEKKEAKHDHDRKPGDGNEAGNIY
ncbi:MAG: hypothetical protein J6D57_00870 [Mogibacterium sp.]|nr:hypothetical protein [Mogibacterium sp.]MBR3199985.1 hypothetical protein [Mogibacterium sp.]